jgi:two-component system cell cycle sensor histidine kinase/response regulator CckA
VLVIEDEPAILELIQTGLERAGYRVLTATDGAEGISVFGKHHADISVVVVDMMLPLIDGATSIRMFRRLVPEMEIVAISGLPSLRAAASESRTAG